MHTEMKKIDLILTGFLSAIGMAHNPFYEKIIEIRRLTDDEKLNNDLRKVTEDFGKVYEREAKQIER
jgi:hypothetical protein